MKAGNLLLRVVREEEREFQSATQRRALLFRARQVFDGVTVTQVHVGAEMIQMNRAEQLFVALRKLRLVRRHPESDSRKLALKRLAQRKGDSIAYGRRYRRPAARRNGHSLRKNLAGGSSVRISE